MMYNNEEEIGSENSQPKNMADGMPKLSNTLNRNNKSNSERGKLPKNDSDEKKMDAQMQLALRNHAYVTEFIKLADQKAGFIFAISTSLMAYLFANGMHKSFIANIAVWTFYDFVKFICFFALTGTSLCAFWVVKPRLKVYKTKGLIFWESVSAYDNSNDYVADVIDKTKQGIINEILEHHYALSNVCLNKYYWLKISVILGSIGSLLGIIVLMTK